MTAESEKTRIELDSGRDGGACRRTLGRVHVARRRCMGNAFRRASSGPWAFSVQDYGEMVYLAAELPGRFQKLCPIVRITSR